MVLDHSLVGVPSAPFEHSWTSFDALLYAVGVGAGSGDPLKELEFTTENRVGFAQRVLPTFGVIIARHPVGLAVGEFDHTGLVAADQYLEQHAPIPPAGTVRTVSTVIGLHDKGSGALAVVENVAREATGGTVLVTSRSGYFIRGEGGFGASRGPRTSWQLPDREPDRRLAYRTRPEQALIYRLTGDRNPLHVDPVFAGNAGFDRPILHGLCTYGITGRALLHAVCDSDPARFRSMYGRFTSPVQPGDELEVSIWLPDGDIPGDTALFRTSRTDGTVVLDHGSFTFVPRDERSTGSPT